MSLSKLQTFILAAVLSTLSFISVSAQSYGSISGTVTDASDQSPLLGANIMIDGTAIGTTTDRDGKYRLVKIQSGRTLVLFRYLGYKTDSVWVNVVNGRIVELNIEMKPEAIEGEAVVVTAQLQGQAAAINQQLTSNTIVNVVSKDKIEELPDQNAAESIGRLPGISVERNAGEGTKVVVRGLSPKFNSITVNGEKIPSTDAVDRSVDLSMVSSDMLEGIEVYKALTPDKDADAVGGTVNFVVKKAPKNLKGDFRFQEGYNNHESDFSPYRGSLSLSNRFFNDKLGVIVTGNIQRANRSSDLLDASYSFSRETGTESRAIIDVDNLNLGDRQEIRNRYGASLTLDYDLENGNLMLSTLWSRTDRDEIRRRKRYRVSAAYVEYWLRNMEVNTTMLSNTLSGNFNLGFLNSNLDFRLSYSQSDQDMPFSHDSQFRELGAFTNSLITDMGPEYIPLGAKNNLEETTFKQDFLDSELTTDKNLTAQFDYKIPYNFGSSVTGDLKLGGKLRGKSRNRDKTEYMTLAFTIDEIGKANPGVFNVTRENKVKIDNFYDDSYSVGEFLKGQYVFGPANALSPGKLNDFMNKYWSSYILNGAIDLEDYEASENIYAAYLMTEIKIGQKLVFLPGVRYEYTRTDYKNVWGNTYVDENGETQLLQAKDTTGIKKYGEFLPMIHIKYKVSPFFDIRLAVTRTLSRPDYFNLVPWERISYGDNTVERGEPDLKHTKVWNYDLFLSLYNDLGLFTVGAFYKTLRDIDYIRTNRVLDPGPTYGFQLTQPENSKSKTEVYGGEMELQTNLRFLPSPFDGIVINANFSVIRSKTFYPLFEIGPRSTTPPYKPIIIDTVREGRMPGQANTIANLSIGYEKGDFTARVSMIYQGDALQTVGTRSELDGFTNSFVRWDLAVQYNFLKELGVYFNMNNFTNRPEKAYLGIESFLTREEYFGWTADLGLRYRL